MLPFSFLTPRPASRAQLEPDADIPATLQGRYVIGAPTNNPRKELTEEHPCPLVFIHGTTDNTFRWQKAATYFAAQGYSVWAFNYGQPEEGRPAIPGVFAVNDINESALEIAATIDYILEVTGSSKVDLVGHSQGGLHIKKYIAEHGGQDTVRRAVGVAATYHGTTMTGMSSILQNLVDRNPEFADLVAGKAAIQQLSSSDFISRLNELPDTHPNVMYTNIFTSKDLTATPNSTSQLESIGGADVADAEVGEVCGLLLPPGHASLPENEHIIGLIEWGLTREQGDHTPVHSGCNGGQRWKLGYRFFHEN